MNLRHVSGGLAVLAIIFALSGCGGKQSARGAPAGKVTVRIASDCTYPPMEFLDADKNPTGFGVAVIKAAAEAGGFNVEVKNTAWDGIFAGLAAGDYDAIVSSVTITDERKKEMDFTEPYINAGQVLVVRTETKGIGKLEDLAGKKVGAQIGTTGAMAIAKVPVVKLANYDEIGLAFEDLVQGRIEGVVTEKPVASNYALLTDKYKGKLVIATEPFTDEYFGIAVKKGNRKIVDLINGGIEAITKNGKLDELKKTWLEPKQE